MMGDHDADGCVDARGNSEGQDLDSALRSSEWTGCDHELGGHGAYDGGRLRSPPNPYEPAPLSRPRAPYREH